MVTPKACIKSLRELADRVDHFLGVSVSFTDYLSLLALTLGEVAGSVGRVNARKNLSTPEAQDIWHECMRVLNALSAVYDDAANRQGFDTASTRALPGIPNDLRRILSGAAASLTSPLTPLDEVRLSYVAAGVTHELVFQEILGLRLHTTDRIVLLANLVTKLVHENPARVFGLPRREQNLVLSERIGDLGKDSQHISRVLSGYPPAERAAYRELLHSAISIDLANASADLDWLAARACLHARLKNSSASFATIQAALDNHRAFYVSRMSTRFPSNHFTTFETETSFTFETVVNAITSGLVEVWQTENRRYVLRDRSASQRTFFLTLPDYKAFAMQHGSELYTEYEADPLLFAVRNSDARGRSIVLESREVLRVRLLQIEKEIQAARIVQRGGDLLSKARNEALVRIAIEASGSFFIDTQLRGEKPADAVVDVILGIAFTEAVWLILKQVKRASKPARRARRHTSTTRRSRDD